MTPKIVILSQSKFNREAWLNEIAIQMTPLFKGFKINPYRVTCGWPSRHALSRKVRRIGECHALESSSGGVHEIFISPTVGESILAAGVVCHELCHIAATIDAGHGKGFTIVCKHVGMTKGKPTQVLPGDKLNERLQKVIDNIGAYPHQAIEPLMKKVVKQSNYIKLECNKCGCKVSISATWLSDAGPPTCGCGNEMEVI